MRTPNNSPLTALVLLTIVIGVVGCKMNGGPWYKPGSYSMHNPFKSQDDSHHVTTTKPSIGAQPNVTPPPGGYGTKQVLPQYGNTVTGGMPSEADRVATSVPAVPGGNMSIAGYTDPGPHNPHPHPTGGMPYNPGPFPNPGVMPPHYQTSLVQPALPSDYSPNYPPVPSGHDYNTSNTGTPLPWGSHPPYDPASAGGFMPQAPPIHDNIQGGFPPNTHPHGPQPPSGFDAPINHGHGSVPPSYGGSGYIVQPSTVGAYSF